MDIELFDANMTTKQQMRYSLCRFYNKEGTLLYVSQNPNMQIITNKEWWWLVTNIQVEHFPTPGGMVDAKDQALKHENPLWNIQNIHREL